MERFAWKGYIKEGKDGEYIKRHNEIWPEMTEVLNEAGIHNYTIWKLDNELFGYYECESIEKAIKIQAESAVVQRWDKFMDDILTKEIDENGDDILPKQVFLHI